MSLNSPAGSHCCWHLYKFRLFTPSWMYKWLELMVALPHRPRITLYRALKLDCGLFVTRRVQLILPPDRRLLFWTLRWAKVVRRNDPPRTLTVLLLKRFWKSHVNNIFVKKFSSVYPRFRKSSHVECLHTPQLKRLLDYSKSPKTLETMLSLHLPLK